MRSFQVHGKHLLDSMSHVLVKNSDFFGSTCMCGDKDWRGKESEVALHQPFAVACRVCCFWSSVHAWSDELLSSIFHTCVDAENLNKMHSRLHMHKDVWITALWIILQSVQVMVLLGPLCIVLHEWSEPLLLLEKVIYYIVPTLHQFAGWVHEKIVNENQNNLSNLSSSQKCPFIITNIDLTFERRTLHQKDRHLFKEKKNQEGTECTSKFVSHFISLVMLNTPPISLSYHLKIVLSSRGFR